jgi:hypothetical protein
LIIWLLLAVELVRGVMVAVEALEVTELLQVLALLNQLII